MQAIEKFGEGKSVILIPPADAGGISEFIKKNLEYYGFDVYLYQIKPYKYKSFSERAINFFRKNLLQDRTYKQIQQGKVAIEKLQNFINTHGNFDYALFIRGDLPSLELIDFVKKYARHTVCYQWDGLDRFPDIIDRIELFDKFFVFDKADLVKYANKDLTLTTNFYFDFDKEPAKDDGKNTMYFVGAHLTQRLDSINKFLNIAYKHKIPTNFILAGNSDKQKLYQHPVRFVHHLDYKDNLEYAKQSGILIDFVNPLHNGLSFRAFEALYYQKKLITNNQDIVNYDFYHPDNIFVWDGVSIDEPSFIKFLAKPYHQIPQEIVGQYAFRNWVKKILSI